MKRDNNIKSPTGIRLFLRMLKELGKLTPIMLLTITFGVFGFLFAAAINIIISILAVGFLTDSLVLSLNLGIGIVIACALMRGVVRYAEQLSGHYIAFRILALLRDKVFGNLRKLAPAKLDSKEKGNIISLITSDIELMEVFYAHTIAPVAIAFITSIIFISMLFKLHIAFAILAAISYVILGIILPIIFTRSSAQGSEEYRKSFANNNAYLLDTLRGVKEIIFFKKQDKIIQSVENKAKTMTQCQKSVKKYEGLSTAITDLIIMLSIFSQLFLGWYLYTTGAIEFNVMVIAVVMIASSFGSVVALSALSTTLSGTLASAKRVFDILDETPIVDEESGTKKPTGKEIVYNKVGFQYPGRNVEVIKDISFDIKNNNIVGIIGESGSGKSTIIKLLMRFYDPHKGKISIGNTEISECSISSLRNIEGLVEQSTFIYNDTVFNNICIENSKATMENVIDAAKKASIHETIMALPNEYDTVISEMGDSLSAGEKQRIALARVFLKDSDIIILDEPTSNLDVLNEAHILKSLKDNAKDKIIILVSHRDSTIGICDKVYKIENGVIAN